MPPGHAGSGADRRARQDCATAWGGPPWSLSLTTENQTEHEPDAERGKDSLGWVFAHVLFGILLETADAIARVIPGLFRFAAVFTGEGAGDRLKILGRLAHMRGAALDLVLRSGWDPWFFVCFLFASHISSC